MSSKIIENLPPISQLGESNDTIEYEFVGGKDEYTIVKGPAKSISAVTSGETLYVEGTDYDVVLTEDEEIEAIDFGIGGKSPSDGDLFRIDQTYESVLSRYLEAHDESFQRYRDDLTAIEQIRQVDNATGSELDRIGAIFGKLGRRRGRTNSDYRTFLKGVIDSFNGRGTTRGLKFAIASAIGTVPKNVTIEEDFQNLEYNIEITNVNAGFISKAINDLAELADPSAVELDEAIIITGGDNVIIQNGASSSTIEYSGLGSDDLDGNATLG